MIVACVKVKPNYGPEYVNRLAAMVLRHTTLPYRFLCLTDNPKGVQCDCAPIGTDAPGWWAKLILFKPHPALAGQRVLFLDLDTVIVGNMDPLLAYQGDFAILRDFYRPTGYGSGIMGLAPGAAPQVWSNFIRKANGSGVMAEHYGDQWWIETQVPTADRWQDVCPGLIGSYKADKMADSPKGFAVCCFHGLPKPEHVNGWVAREWR